MFGELNKQIELKDSILSLLNRDDFSVDVLGIMEILKDYCGSMYLTNIMNQLEEYELKSKNNNY